VHPIVEMDTGNSLRCILVVQGMDAKPDEASR